MGDRKRKLGSGWLKDTLLYNETEKRSRLSTGVTNPSPFFPNNPNRIIELVSFPTGKPVEKETILSKSPIMSKDQLEDMYSSCIKLCIENV